MKRSWRLKLPAEKVAAVAAKLVDKHARSNGLTARFVYRSGDGSCTTTYIFRGIR